MQVKSSRHVVLGIACSISTVNLSFPSYISKLHPNITISYDIQAHIKPSLSSPFFFGSPVYPYLVIRFQNHINSSPQRPQNING